MSKRFTIAIIAFGFAAVPFSAAPSAEWGSLKGRFIVDGTVPEPQPLVVTREQFCIDKKPVDETVVVGDNNELANAVVYIRLGRRDTIDVHPDFEAQLSEPVELDNQACHFVPHVTVVRKGQTIVIKNSDPVGHNTNLTFFGFNPTVPAGGETQMTVERDGPLPTPVVCNIHPFMKGYVLAQDHPYMSVSAEDGTFEINNIPAGEREFTFWHEAKGYMRDLKVAGGTADRQGKVALEIKPGETLDLGDIQVPAAMLK